MRIEVQTNSAVQTEKLGQKIGLQLKGGEVIELVSDLGGGKTTFVRGLVKGAGSQDIVSSPSFTIKNVYQANGFEIHHFDFYRLEEAGITGHELEDVIGDKDKVIVLEWAGVAEDSLPKNRLKIELLPNKDDSRLAKILVEPEFEYLLEDV